jgi:hypothetical protein
MHFLDEPLEVFGVPGPDRLALSAFLETWLRILPDRLEHPHPPALGDDQAVLGQTLERAEHVLDRIAGTDPLCRRDRPAAGEDRQSCEER